MWSIGLSPKESNNKTTINKPKKHFSPKTPSSDDQEPEHYYKGGYHPVQKGEIFNNRYKALCKIGWGFFSTVWLAHDSLKGLFVALKIVKSEQIFTQAARDEIQLLKKVIQQDQSKNSKVIRILDSFVHLGSNGKHVCMVFELLDGTTLLTLMKKYEYKGIPIPLLKNICRQVLIGLDFLHAKCKIIHTDMKPENVMIYHESDVLSDSIKGKIRKSGFDVDKILSYNKRRQRGILQTKKLKQRPKKKMYQNILKRNTQSANIRKKNLTLYKKRNVTHLNKQLHSKLKIRNKKSSKKLNFQFIEMIQNHSKDPFYQELELLNHKILDLEILLDKETYEDLIPIGKSYIFNQSSESSFKKNDFNEKDKEKSKGKEKEKKENYKENGIKDKKSIPTKKLTTKCKIIDLGNACWIQKHFTSEIQTREYRSPEVILGHEYDQSADIWSLGCMIFELLTGDVLFTPNEGSDYSNAEDHLALIMELLGKIPKDILTTGKKSYKFVERSGNLRHIKKLEFWSLKNVFMTKYKFNEQKAKEMSDFLTPMFEYDIKKRITAKQLLNHPWIKTRLKKNKKI
ncbi:hypothetical protein M0813_21467 [Anaeramoeba flamelloides]|uniref:non-specific serine/threonine protein kinase n=1 Tax=Anaeramoeba flamelloides TaxID=1746091 RepID=A0ABQ8YHZ3_9EUKA|nr:hypothetical protein M0813_21467 [Anaeramoeba flamelloides]